MRVGSARDSFDITSFIAYLYAGGASENVQGTAAHESPRSTKLYARMGDEITFDEVERIAILPREGLACFLRANVE
jgi:hypothetical protein